MIWLEYKIIKCIGIFPIHNLKQRKKMNIKNSMNKIFDSILELSKKDNIELYEKLSNSDKKIDYNSLSPEDFYIQVIYPHEQYIEGLISIEISKNEDVQFILTNSNYIESHFQYWIKSLEGFACNFDKVRTILDRLLKFYKDGTKIEFNYNQEPTYHLPKLVFNNHNDIIEFYTAIKSLLYGNPEKYLKELKKISQINKEGIEE